MQHSGVSFQPKTRKDGRAAWPERSRRGRPELSTRPNFCHAERSLTSEAKSGGVEGTLRFYSTHWLNAEG
jgi:hypothetical protein